MAQKDTCERAQCGSNAICRENYQGIVCECQPGYFGNPYLSCRPECVLNSDCPATKTCINNKCEDPCRGACGVGALCEPVNHFPVCLCPSGTSGDPFVSCSPVRPDPPARPANPCDPSPCGPYSRCLVSPQGYAVCSCLPEYRGAPPMCKPECVISAECPQIHACSNQKCVDPCPGTCGLGAQCHVVNHNPICSCPSGQVGDPFTRCYTPLAVEEEKTPGNPCEPSPCGGNSICVVRQGRPVCSCLPNYIGSPPYCRPECTISQECPSDKACVKEKCKDPCIESCGTNAQCNVVNHTPHCSCLQGYQGDAFIGCSRIPERKFFLKVLFSM